MKSLRVPLLLLVLTAPTVVLATGFGGSDAPTRIPVPARVFSATVMDISGTEVSVTRVSFNGEVAIYGLVGEAQVSVPFEKIAEVRVEPSGDPDTRVALVRLHTGESVRVVVEHDVPCYGDAAFGHYRIDADKIRRITFPAP